MNVNRQATRSASTRAKLLSAARTLFAREGYAAVGTEQIVRRAGVTRGALYHQFPAKEDLFLAVYEQVEEELTTRVAQSLRDVSTAYEALYRGIAVFLEECQTEEVQRIVLIDGPAVLGWERWREVADRYGLGLLEEVVGAAIEAGELVAVPVAPLAHLLMGALDEGALLVVREPDSLADVITTFERLVEGLRAKPKGSRPAGAARSR
jgi:AcrR family transcriptional regulator